MSRPKSVPLLLVACAVLGTVPPVVAQPRAEPPAPVREAPAAASTTPPAPDGAPLSVAEVTRPAPDLEGIAAEAGGLTTGEVVRRALAASASLREKVAALRGAEEKIQQTMLQFVPRLTATGSYTRLSPVSAGFGSGALVGAGAEGLLTTGPCPGGAPGTCVLDSSGQPAGAARFAVKQLEDSYSVGARLTIPLSDYLLRVSDAAASSEAGREASRLAVEAERLAVATTARTLYFNWLRARASAAIARKAVERTRARLEDARSAFTVGAISRADLLRVEALVANTELLAARSETMVSLTTGQLAILMEDPRPDYRVGEGVPPPASSPLVERPVLELVREAHELRLEVRAIDESLRATRRGASATRAGELPRLDAIGDITHANPNQRFFPPQQVWNTTWAAGVQASFTVGDAFLNAAAARELEASAEGLEAARRGLRAAIAQQVLAAYLEHQRARAALSQQAVALAAATEAYRVTSDLFRVGRATGTDLIEAESGLLDAKLGDVNAHIDLSVSRVALEHATARDRAGAPAP